MPTSFSCIQKVEIGIDMILLTGPPLLAHPAEQLGALLRT